MASVTIIEQPSQAENSTAQNPTFSAGDAAVLLTAALAGASMSKAARRQFRALTRKMAWRALGSKLKDLFGKKNGGNPVAGMDPLVFWLLVAAVALLGILLFGFWGFLVIAALGVIIYLLLKQGKG